MRAIGADLRSATWHKSSHSNGQGGDCLEVTFAVRGVVPIRDSKCPDAGILPFPSASWTRFLDEVQRVGQDRTANFKR